MPSNADEFVLVCTPLGFVRLFDVVGQFLIKPQFLHDISEEYFAYALEEECLRRRLKHAQNTGMFFFNPAPMCIGFEEPVKDDHFKLPENFIRLRNGELMSGLGERLMGIEKRRKLLGNVTLIIEIKCLFFTSSLKSCCARVERKDIQRNTLY